MSIRHALLLTFLVVSSLVTATASAAAEAKVAVAANFTEPAREIAKAFEKATGHKLLLSFGATGQFYAQIVQGAPFDVLLSADKATPAKAVSEGHAVGARSFTYATGRLALYSRSSASVSEATLRDGKFARIAIANPAAAPYGVAAVETLKALGLYVALQGKIVQGNNIGQAFQFVETGNAEVGFVALSQAIAAKEGNRWLVPAHLYSPIAQDAVLLRSGEGNAAAIAFLDFLKGPEARKVIEKFGYGID